MFGDLSIVSLTPHLLYMSISLPPFLILRGWCAPLLAQSHIFLWGSWFHFSLSPSWQIWLHQSFPPCSGFFNLIFLLALILGSQPKVFLILKKQTNKILWQNNEKILITKKPFLTRNAPLTWISSVSFLFCPSVVFTFSPTPHSSTYCTLASSPTTRLTQFVKVANDLNYFIGPICQFLNF